MSSRRSRHRHQRQFEALHRVSAQTSALRAARSSPSRRTPFPGPSEARRTPLGNLTLTIPLCRKNKELAGSPAPMMRWPPDSRAPRRQFGQRGDLLGGQSGEQRLLAEMRGLLHGGEAAIAIDDLVLGPFDGVVEQREPAQRCVRPRSSSRIAFHNAEMRPRPRSRSP